MPSTGTKTPSKHLLCCLDWAGLTTKGERYASVTQEYAGSVKSPCSRKGTNTYTLYRSCKQTQKTMIYIKYFFPQIVPTVWWCVGKVICPQTLSTVVCTCTATLTLPKLSK